MTRTAIKQAQVRSACLRFLSEPELIIGAGNNSDRSEGLTRPRLLANVEEK
jgi:hypothetical protein